MNDEQLKRIIGLLVECEAALSAAGAGDNVPSHGLVFACKQRAQLCRTMIKELKTTNSETSTIDSAGRQLEGAR